MFNIVKITRWIRYLEFSVVLHLFCPLEEKLTALPLISIICLVRGNYFLLIMNNFIKQDFYTSIGTFSFQVY